MASRGSNLLFGCCLGCAVVLLVIGVGVVGCGLFVGDMMSGFEDAVAQREALEERFGATDEFVPPPDGAVAPERMEAFLEVREATADERRSISDFFAGIKGHQRALDDKSGIDKLGAVFEVTRSAIGFGTELGRFFEARNAALTEVGMGLGEYTYVYALAYHSWLGHPPGDGPEDALSDDGNVEVQIGHTDHDTGRRVRRDLRRMLANQLQNLGQLEAGDPWSRTLEREIEKLEDDPGRVPWQDGLPPQIEASFEPYREALEATYDPLVNSFELARNQKRGRWSVEAE